ncbi:MAG: carboxypeptidase regulatory-like domain-containing protein [Bacteroidia bacterium]
MKKLASFMVVILAAASAFAQVTTAHLGGVVSNGENAVENATVTALLTTTNAKYSTDSRTGGVYDLLNLQAGGPYTVTISVSGGKTVTYSGIYLQLGETYRLDIDMAQDGGNMGEVSITSSRKGTQTGASFNISSQTLNTLPTISRSLNDFTRLTPQAGGNSSFNGRDGRMNNITIDGANFNNNFGLSTNNMPGGDAQPISLDAIEAVQVNVSPFDVRQSNFTGAGVNAITRSGSNLTTASIYSFVRNQNFNGNKIGDVELTNIPESTSKIFGFPCRRCNQTRQVVLLLELRTRRPQFPWFVVGAYQCFFRPQQPQLVSRIGKRFASCSTALERQVRVRDWRLCWIG